jgi:FixJ family two-component response regulator
MTPPTAIVFVIDDDPSVRRAIKRLLTSVGLESELFGSATEFLSHKYVDGTSCIVLDIRLPGMSGLELQQELKKSGNDIPVIFITSYGDIPMTVRAMKAGAVDVLPKPFRDQDLLDSIQVALERDKATRLRNIEISALRARFAALTPREREVLPLVVSGLPNKQIAAVIGTSVTTVKVHRSQLTRKIGANSVADLVRMAEKLKIETRDYKPASRQTHN